MLLSFLKPKEKKIVSKKIQKSLYQSVWGLVVYSGDFSIFSKSILTKKEHRKISPTQLMDVVNFQELLKNCSEWQLSVRFHTTLFTQCYKTFIIISIQFGIPNATKSRKTDLLPHIISSTCEQNTKSRGRWIETMSTKLMCTANNKYSHCVILKIRWNRHW